MIRLQKGWISDHYYYYCYYYYPIRYKQDLIPRAGVQPPVGQEPITSVLVQWYRSGTYYTCRREITCIDSALCHASSTKALLVWMNSKLRAVSRFSFESRRSRTRDLRPWQWGIDYEYCPPFFHKDSRTSETQARVTFSRVGWFSRALAFRSLYYPWGKMGDYS